jgi:tetratricopeptide (TPR) repeat protein
MDRRGNGFARSGWWRSLILSGLATVMTLQGCGEAPPAQADTKTESAASLLLRDINAYRDTAASLEPQASVKQWFALYDRAASLETGGDGDFVFDPAVLNSVGEHSMLAALPAPPAWGAFRAEAGRRADAGKAGRETLGLRFLAELLTNDREAAARTLSALENKDTRDTVSAARSLLAHIYGDADAQVAAFRAEIAAPSSELDYEGVKVPDLVGLVGQDRAAALLTEAIASHRKLANPNGEATRALARRVALRNLNRMRTPQWSLAQSVDAASLYEAMSSKFRAGGKASAEEYDWAWRNAAAHYFLEMVRTGREAAAEETLVQLAAGGTVQISREAIEALQRAQLNEPLFRFLDGLLARRPELQAWDVYIEQAAFTGHSAGALALIERLLRRDDISAALRLDLQAKRAAALLAADRIEDAKAGFLVLLEKSPEAGEASLRTRREVAIIAARAGRLLDDEPLARLGADFLRASLELPEARESTRGTFEARRALYSELRRQGRSEHALELATRSLEAKPASFTDALARRMGVQSDDDRQSLVEAVGIHSAAGRHGEVLKLLSGSARWGASDLAEVLTVEDSQKQPLGALAARALQATGDKAAALRAARATVAALPGRDAGYEIIAALDPDAISVFETLYGSDEFEERPLIWKASVQLTAGAPSEAESTIRRAIAVDPSDGEQGPNDRMRAYAVLSSILLARGERSNAQLYGNAVEAIRLSERGDELHEAGLYERAFRKYRDALAKFSDAYCIQSRLAVQLNKQGRRKEALEHYRRAYELMPSSFGKVESHCFGCESVFQGPESQSLAERVFNDILRKSPDRPQAHYMLAYLREQQGRHADAVQPLRAAVSLDSHYLNAWKRLHELADHTYLEAGELDIARLKLLELDPLQRHVHYQLDEVGQLAALWNGIDRAHSLAASLEPPEAGLFPLTASAAIQEQANSDTPDELRDMQRLMFSSTARKGPAVTFYEHKLVASARSLMGLDVGED